MLKVEEIRGLGVEEIREKVDKMKKDLMQYRFQAKTGKLERQTTIKEVRRDIARLLTIMNQKSAETPVAAKPAKKAVVAAKSGAKKGAKS
jgi:large subunit ribosomal protein L29